MVSQIRFG